jgi:hypothetical protein
MQNFFSDAKIQLREVRVPDVNPSSLGRQPDGSPLLQLSSGLSLPYTSLVVSP